MHLPFKEQKQLSKKEYEKLDKYAWNAICNWHTVIDFNPVHKDLDYNHLTRRFLWDKVSRAIRFQHPLIDSSLEESLMKNIYPKDKKINNIGGPSFLSKIFMHLKLSYNILIFKLKLITRGKKKILIPVPWRSKRLEKIYPLLIKSGKYDLLCKANLFDNFLLIIMKNIKEKNINLEWSKQLYKAIILGLSKFDIFLLDDDKKKLELQLQEQYYNIQNIEKELRFLKPNLILWETDNFPPLISYMLVARKMSVPTMIVQHGLDCEHYYLDEAYASNICVWGTHRNNRYVKKSTYQPRLYIAGNPLYDGSPHKTNSNNNENYFVWLTRPYSPLKCFSVSRNPNEGKYILETLIMFLEKNPNERLYVKLHPHIGINIIKKLIQNSKVATRIRIVDNAYDYLSLIKNAKFVLSEDSSAGLDAILLNKALIHVHFAKTKPVIPFVDYRCALPGFSKSELTNSLNKICCINKELSHSFSGRKGFIRDFAGKMDGNASKRINKIIDNITAKESLSI